MHYTKLLHGERNLVLGTTTLRLICNNTTFIFSLFTTWDERGKQMEQYGTDVYRRKFLMLRFTDIKLVNKVTAT